MKIKLKLPGGGEFLFQRALIYLYTKRLEKLGITAEIKVEKVQDDE